MKVTLPLRIIINNLLPGVLLKVQTGKDGLIDASNLTEKQAVFDVEITADIATDQPNFLGKVTQGPKDARFVYLNWGKQAGQAFTHWSRRAKLSLMSISKQDIEKVTTGGKRLQLEIDGVGRDGGPVCASIKGISWKIV